MGYKIITMKRQLLLYLIKLFMGIVIIIICWLALTSGNILARMGKNQYVSMETIEKICKKMNCTIDEMMEFTD